MSKPINSRNPLCKRLALLPQYSVINHHGSPSFFYGCGAGAARIAKDLGYLHCNGRGKRKILGLEDHGRPRRDMWNHWIKAKDVLVYCKLYHDILSLYILQIYIYIYLFIYTIYVYIYTYNMICIYYIHIYTYLWNIYIYI